MTPPDMPSDEETRLSTLRSLGILDTVKEERFDRLTRLTRRMFGVPIALVSLVDSNRQWFKSCIGLDASETSRDISFCGHAILGDEIFVIADAAKDRRFRDNPLVTDAPHIRFYAGCPLKAANGSKLGTLCIIDRVPRTLNREYLAALKDLATLVENELTATETNTIDDLTGVLSKRGFSLLAQHSLNLCLRQKTPTTQVIFDLDRFKRLNEQLGRAEGDKALMIFTNCMKKALRSSDLFGRLDGDHFVALLTNTAKESTEMIIQRARKLLMNHPQTNSRGYTISFTYSCIDFSPEYHRSIDDLLADGETLMSEHKQAVAEL